MQLRTELAKQDVETGSIRFSLAEDAAYPNICGAMPLYEQIKAQWALYTNSGAFTSPKELNGAALKIIDNSVKYDGTIPSGLRGFISSIQTLASAYYYNVHQPSVELAKLEGKKIETRE